MPRSIGDGKRGSFSYDHRLIAAVKACADTRRTQANTHIKNLQCYLLRKKGKKYTGKQTKKIKKITKTSEAKHARQQH